VKFVPVILIALLFPLIPGCAGYHPVPLPNDPSSSSEIPTEGAESLSVGDDVRITLLSGDVLQGEVVGLTPDVVTIGKPGNYGWVETTVAYRDMQGLEAVREPLGMRVLFGATSTVFVVGAVVLILFSRADFSGLS